IERYTAFVIVEAEPKETFLGIRLILVKRAKPAGGIASPGFYLYNVGAEVAENLAAQETKLVGQVQNSKRGEQAQVAIRRTHRCAKKSRARGPALNLLRGRFLMIYLPVRANEWTQPCMRDLAFWMSFSLNHRLRSILSTG